jgi:hypothetical protein
MALREMGGATPLENGQVPILLAELLLDRASRAAVRWHRKLELESPSLTMAEAQFALGALASLLAGDMAAAEILRRLAKRAQPTLVPRFLG